MVKRGVWALTALFSWLTMYQIGALAQEAQLHIAAVGQQNSPGSPASIEETSLPPPTLGDRCVYDVSTLYKRWVEIEQVVNVNQKGYVTEFLEDGVRKGTRTYYANGVRRLQPLLQYPLSVGKKWEVEYSIKTATSMGAGSLDYKLTGEVIRIHQEMVGGKEVPVVTVNFSGGFTEFYPGEGSYGGVVKYTLTYAPTLRCIVSSERLVYSAAGHGKTTMVLQSYHSGG